MEFAPWSRENRVGSRRSGGRAGSAGSAPAELPLALGRTLQGCGFRPLSLATQASGPFARQTGEDVFIRLEPTVFSIAFVTRADTEADLVRFIDHQGLNAWGYDLNHDNHAHQTEVVNELRFVVTRTARRSAPNSRGAAMYRAMKAGCTVIPTVRSRRSAPPSRPRSIPASVGSCCPAPETSSARPNNDRGSARPKSRTGPPPTSPPGVFPLSMTAIPSGP